MQLFCNPQGMRELLPHLLKKIKNVLFFQMLFVGGCCWCVVHFRMVIRQALAEIK